jgi:hypothetical protein
MTNPQPSGNHSRAFRKARRELERVIQAGDPEQSPRAALELGALFKAYGQPEAAERAYQRALGFGHREVAARAQVELESLRSSGAGSADGRPRWWSTVNGNVFVGLFGVVSVFIGVFDVSSPIKLGYLLVALVVCFLIALVVRPNQASARWSSRAGWWRAAIVVVALLLALGVRPLIQVVSPQSVSTGATLPQACSAGLPIGQGAPSASVSKAFRDAYLLAGIRTFTDQQAVASSCCGRTRAKPMSSSERSMRDGFPSRRGIQRGSRGWWAIQSMLASIYHTACSLIW